MADDMRGTKGISGRGRDEVLSDGSGGSEGGFDERQAPTKFKYPSERETESYMSWFTLPLL